MNDELHIILDRFVLTGNCYSNPKNSAHSNSSPFLRQAHLATAEYRGVQGMMPLAHSWTDGVTMDVFHAVHSHLPEQGPCVQSPDSQPQWQ